MTHILQVISRDNPKVKEARRVRDGRQRDKIFIEGVRLLEEAVRSQIRIDCFFVSTEARERVGHIVHAAGSGEVYELGDAAFQSLADTVNSQGILAVAGRPGSGRDQIAGRITTAVPPLVVFLTRTNNPSNLGAVVRTVDAAGAAGVIVSSGSADPFSPKGLRAAMGSSFRSPIWTDASFEEALEWARSNGIQTVSTEASASSLYTEVDWTRPSMLLMGSEAHGLTADQAGSVDMRVAIPMERPVESLNLAVACGVVVYEARRQTFIN